MKSILAERPYFPQLFPHILEFGDRAAREFVLNFARATETPELLQVLYDLPSAPMAATHCGWRPCNSSASATPICCRILDK
ncbi:MAG: hypothetical protein M5U34_22630 [Chloroflexi bacterium]|nr:hypothetical protein [Chloroflexota bacterium]